MTLTTSPASAEIAVTVTAGDAPPGTTVAVTGASAGFVRLNNADAGVMWDCGSATATSSVTTGTQASSTPLATLRDVRILDCVGLGVELLVQADSPWQVTVSGASDIDGVTPVTISGVVLHVEDSGTGGSIWSFDVHGDAAGTMSEEAGKLRLSISGATLTLTNPSGVFGSRLFLDGDAFEVAGDFDVTADNPAYNPIQVTSA